MTAIPLLVIEYFHPTKVKVLLLLLLSVIRFFSFLILCWVFALYHQFINGSDGRSIVIFYLSINITLLLYIKIFMKSKSPALIILLQWNNKCII